MCEASGFYGEQSLREMFCYSGALFNKFLKEFFELSWTGSVEIALNSSSPGHSEPRVWPVITKVYSRGCWGKVVLGAHPAQAHCRFSSLRFSDWQRAKFYPLGPVSFFCHTTHNPGHPPPSCVHQPLEVVLLILNQEPRLKSLSSKTQNMAHNLAIQSHIPVVSGKVFLSWGDQNQLEGQWLRSRKQVHSTQAHCLRVKLCFNTSS